MQLADNNSRVLVQQVRATFISLLSDSGIPRDAHFFDTDFGSVEMMSTGPKR